MRTIAWARSAALRYLGLALLLCAPGCRGFCTNYVGPGDPPGDGVLRLYGVVTPRDGLASIDLSVLRVDLAYADGVHTAAEGPVEVSLARVGFDVPLLLLEVFAPPGEIAQIRLVSAGGTAIFESGAFEARVPPGETTGLRIIPEPGERFVVETDKTTRVLVRIDGEEFLRPDGPADFRIRPVVRGTTEFPSTISDYLAANEQVIHLVNTAFPGLGITVSRGVALNTATGTWHELTIDEQGNLASMVDLRAAERVAMRERFGRLAPSLVAALGLLKDDDLVTVAVWLGADEMPSLRDLDPGAPNFSEAVTARLAEMRSVVGAAVGAFAPVLADPEVVEFTAGDSSPVVRVVATKRFVETVLAVRPEVVVTYDGRAVGLPLAGSSWGDVNDFAGFPPTSGAGAVPVALLGEREPGICALNQPWETNAGVVVAAVMFPGSDACTVGVPHAEAVTVAVGTTETSVGPVGAWAAPRLIANWAAPFGGPFLDAASVLSGVEWAIDPSQTGLLDPAFVASFSFVGGASDTANVSAGRGVLDGYEVALDYAVQAFGLLVTRGAGNAGDEFLPGGWISNCFDTGLVDECAQTDCDDFNTVCVGGYDHGARVLSEGCVDPFFGPCPFDDDVVLWSNTASGRAGSWRNSPSSDRETPEILMSSALAEWVSSQTDPAEPRFGTSFATPFAAGLGAQALAEEPDLRFKPEAVRALLLASAVRHNVIGRRMSSYEPPDESDGVGVPVGSALLESIDTGRWLWGFLDRDTSFVTNTAGERVFSPFGPITVPGNTVIRIALAWSSCVNDSADPSGDSLAAHLDLRARMFSTIDFSLLQEKISVSFDSPYEVVTLHNAVADDAFVIADIVVSRDAMGNPDWGPCIAYGLGDLFRGNIGVAYALLP